MSEQLFISLMPYLKNKSGHDSIYHECVKRAIEAHDIDYVGYISSECALPNLPPDWKKHFSNAEPGLSLFQRMNRRYCDFSAIFRSSADKKRIFFIENFSKLDLLALSLAVVFHSKAADKFWFLFRYPIPPKKFHPYRICSRILHRKLGSRLVCLTDSEKIRETFQNLPFKPHIWPIPHTRCVPLQKEKKMERILCWWPGPPRETKGWEDIRQLTHIEDSDAKHFILMAARSSGLMPNNNLRVELIEDQLSEDQYTQKLAECQAVFLPYDPNQYYASTSGIFVEAVSAHKIPLVKEGSWLADELKRFGLHELIVDWNRSDFFAHVYELVNDPIVRKKLAAMQSSYAEFHNIRNFQQIIGTMLLK